MNTCIEPESLIQKMNKTGNFIIIDVRSAEEFATQHIPLSINIPLDQLSYSAVDFEKNTTYISVCGKGGGRSEKAAELLQSMGFNAMSVCGGMQAWTSYL